MRVFSYFGSKVNLVPTLLGCFPPHRVFVDLFGGTGCVLYAKPRSRYEIYNDLDHHLVNFFRVLEFLSGAKVRPCR